MACNSRVFKIEAANAFFGRRQKTCIDMEEAVAASLDGKYFLVSDLDTDYYVWFNLDGSSIDPAVAAKTGIEVAINSADNVLLMGNALKAAMEGMIGGEQKFISAVETGGCVCIEIFMFGKAKNESADGDTGLPLTNEKVGSYSDLGCLAEDFEISTELSETDITCHQFGETPVDKIITGISSEVELGLLDTSAERFKELIGEGVGGSHTPTGGSELVGIGSASLGKSAFDIGGELRFIPVNNPDDSYIFPLAVAKFNSISFSATEKQVMNVTFSILLDRSVETTINFFHRGKPDQNVKA